MKKVLSIAVSYFFSFIGMAIVLYALNLDYFDSITKIITFSLLYSVPVHIINYIVLPRIRKKDNS